MNEYLVRLKRDSKVLEITVHARDDKQALAKARKKIGKGSELVTVKLVAMAF